MTLPQFGQNIARIDIELADILDLNIVAPAAGDILIYDGNSWDNQAVTGDITITAGGVVAIAAGVIVDADISATAEIAVSKLADGAARQVLETAADGVTVQWTSNVDLPGTLDVTLLATFDTAITLNEGAAQAGTDVYLARDNTGDLTLNALAGKGINLAIAGVDEIQYTTGAMAFQQATILSTTTGDFTINTADQFIVLVPDEKVSAIKFQNSSINFYTMDVRTTIQGTVAHQFDNADVELSNVAALSYRQILLRGYILNVTTDADDITVPGPFMLDVGTTTITSDTASTNFTDVVSSVRIAGLSAGLNVIFDKMAALHIRDAVGAAGTVTIQNGIYIDDLTAGVANTGLSMANRLDLRSVGTIRNIGASNFDITGIGIDYGAADRTLTASSAGVARTLAYDLTVGAGGAANAELWHSFRLDSSTGANEAGMYGETDGSGSLTATTQIWKVPYRDSGANVAAPANPNAFQDGGLRVEAGDDDNRLYMIANGAWHYISQTAGLSFTAEERTMFGHRWEIGDLGAVKIDKHFGDGAPHGLLYPFEQAVRDTQWASTVEERLAGVQEAMDILRAQVVTLGATPEV